MQPRKALCLAMAATRVLEKAALGSGGIRTHASEETGALIQRLRPLGHATHWDVLHGSLRLGIVRPDADSAKKLQSNPLTYDKPDPKRVSACGCVAVTTSLRCIWKNRSTQNWLKLSATEPQAVNKSHRKDVAPGAGLSYPALARRHSSVGEDRHLVWLAFP